MPDISIRGAVSGDFQNNETIAELTIASGTGTFQLHQFLIDCKVIDETETTKTINWELKNTTKDVILASGSWSYNGKTNQLMQKSIEITTNYIGDNIRLRLWLSDSQIALVTTASITVQTTFA